MVFRIPPGLSKFAVPVETLVPFERNPRRGDIEAIADSLKAHGQYRPIVVRAGTNEVLAGNHTLAAARSLGWTEVAATFIEVTDEQAKRIVLVDNRAADRATNDERELLALLRELEDSEATLSGTGFDLDDLDDLAARVIEVERAQLAVVPGAAADADSPDGNAWESTDLKEYAERYEEQGRRLVVLDYDRADYARVTAALDLLRSELGVDSNSKAIAVHLAGRYPDAVPAPEAVAS
jgi:hypothetical protein